MLNVCFLYTEHQTPEPASTVRQTYERMFFNVLATFAEFESDLIRLRTREGVALPEQKENCGGNSLDYLTYSRNNYDRYINLMNI